LRKLIRGDPHSTEHFDLVDNEVEIFVLHRKMSSKRLPSPEVVQSQEAAFIKHYDWLLRWALQFTNHDRERAQDLVQQVFAQFAVAHTDLSAVQDISAYLYTTLRNTHLSEVRLAGRSHGETRSIVEYSVADAALDASDPYALFQTQDQLRRVCEYACLRKESSRAGSVLILRFFHGYHISEIAAVLGGTCQAVRQSLKLARHEARLYLENPGALRFIGRTRNVSVSCTGTVCPADELLAELRRAIFCSCQGECLDNDSLRLLYGERHIVAADNATLAHIVSCAKCLDEINRKLDLPLLAERHPADALGPNNNWRGGSGPSGTSGRSDDSLQSRRRVRSQNQEISSSFLLKCRRRATELFEHHPRELCVSVNGHVLGSQSVSSRTSRLRLDVAITEPLDFIEVMGDERTRLLVMTIDPPPDGEPTQERRVLLSGGRYIEASFRHGHPWPLLEVVYHDPNFTTEPQLSAFDPDDAWTVDSAGNPFGSAEGDSSLEDYERDRVAGTQLRVLAPQSRASESQQAVSLPPKPSAKVTVLDLFRGLTLLRRPFWTRPAFISAVVSVVLIGVLLFLWVNITPTVSAANLLSRATALESLHAGPDLALHRVVEMEERRHPGGEIVNRGRIEIWRSGETGFTARRVYDAQGELIAGEWEGHSQAGGKYLRRIYRRDQPQQIQAIPGNPQDAIRNRQFWQLEPSARDYAALIGNIDAAHVSEATGTYVIDYKSDHTETGLLEATLTLRKSDLHPVAQTLLIKDAAGILECRLTEHTLEQPRLRYVNPATFEPDAELVSSKPNGAKTSKRGVELESPKKHPVVATAALEVELAYALDTFRSRFGDQLSLTKTSAELLEVKGVVDSEETRKEVLSALSHFSNDPAVRIEISTVAEVLAHQRNQPNNVVQEFAASSDAIPLYSELRRYFAEQIDSGAPSDEVDKKVRELAARVVGQSGRALGHALELKQLTSRFSDEQLNELTPSARAKWFSLVRNHAEALRREIASLRGELQPILFNQNPTGETAGVEISSNASLLLSVEKLYRLVLASDEAVRSAFAASSGTATGQLVKSSKFQIELTASEKLAEGIQQAAGRE